MANCTAEAVIGCATSALRRKTDCESILIEVILHEMSLEICFLCLEKLAQYEAQPLSDSFASFEAHL